MSVSDMTFTNRLQIAAVRTVHSGHGRGQTPGMARRDESGQDTVATASTSTRTPAGNETPKVERAGKSGPKCFRYTSLKAPKSARSDRKHVVLTTLPRPEPAASRIPLRFAITCSV